jgi:hypothetical protein
MRNYFLPVLNVTHALTKAGACITIIFILLTACAAPTRHPVITEAYIKPDPVVGEVVTLHIEVLSGKDAADVTIAALLPDEINLVAGDLEWHGSVKANQPQTHEMSICVLRPGENWQIYVGVSSQLSETGSIGDSEILNVKSTTDSASVILGKDYRVSGPANALTAIPEAQNATPTPILPTVSEECSGAQK